MLMTFKENPYAPPAEKRDKAVSRRIRKIARAGLFTLMGLGIGSFGLPIGVWMIGAYYFPSKPNGVTEQTAVTGAITLGVSIGILSLAIFHILAKTRHLNADQSSILEPGSSPYVDK